MLMPNKLPPKKMKIGQKDYLVGTKKSRGSMTSLKNLGINTKRKKKS